MARKLVECIPNFSEGRNQTILKALEDTVSAVPSCALLDVQADESHNRSVFTFVASPDAAAEAAFLLCKKAMELIDMRRHRGAHPRMGATDVIPFVPALNTTLDECVALSREVAERVWRELKIPVFLYEASASSPGRVNLAAIRKGEFEGMPEKLALPEWAPDFGERKIHPTAGVTAVGARMPLVAFNVNLDTRDVSIAKKSPRPSAARPAAINAARRSAFIWRIGIWRRYP